MGTVREQYQELEKGILARRSRILICEDDVTLQPFWQYVIESIDPMADIKWVTTEEAAHHVLKKWTAKGEPYDLIISDVFLSGQKTGVDLWHASLELDTPFIMTSVVSNKKLEKMIGQNEPIPAYLQKPLDPDECREMVRSLLEWSQTA